MGSAATALADHFGSRLIAAPSALARYAQSEGHHRHDAPALVIQPVSIEDVQMAVAHAASHGLSVIGYGAGTSLEGNAAAINPHSLCIDFSQMNRIIDVSPDDLLCVVEPGVTREQLNRDLRDTGLFFPVDPGADATIGGMIATRASGTTTVRYGSMRDNVLALTVVTADGSIVKTGTRARKSAAGYDLTHLFAGSEGTLGLIVEATLRLHGQSEHVIAATWDFNNIASAVDTVIATIQCGVPVARMEVLDEAAIRACNRASGLGLPETPMLFLEFQGSPGAVAEQLETVRMLGEANGAGALSFASNSEDRAALWKARHHALWAAKAYVPGSVAWITDVCVPISHLAGAIARAKAAIDAAGLFAPILGHVGDGNFHIFFILLPDDADAWAKARVINDAVIAHALSVGGTCTGEHGVGIGKRHALVDEHGDAAIALMKRIKDALDPAGMLNPGKLFLPPTG